jgi:non-specific serine/threonine protein kinase
VVFAAAWAEGEVMPLEKIIDYGLSEPDAPVKGPSHTKKEYYGGLTAREREVAALIAHGKSNREIAEAMVVGVRTVETYVTRILNKLVFDSRVQIATWAVERGLAVSTKN